MKSFNLPTEIVNYICELAAGINKLWYPVFSPKTGKLSWKLNKHIHKFKLKVTKLSNVKIYQYIINVSTKNSILFNSPLTFLKHNIKYKSTYLNSCIGKFIHNNNNYNMVVQVCYMPGSNVELSATPIYKTYIYENNIAKYQVIELKKYQEIGVIYVTVRKV